MTLNPQQQQAFDAFKAFLDDPDQTLFCLLGRAGTGKSFTSSMESCAGCNRVSRFRRG